MATRTKDLLDRYMRALDRSEPVEEAEDLAPGYDLRGPHAVPDRPRGRLGRVLRLRAPRLTRVPWRRAGRGSDSSAPRRARHHRARRRPGHRARTPGRRSP